MDKLQILQYKLSLKQRLLKLKRTQSFHFLLGLASLIVLFMTVCYQPSIKNQYFKISLGIMAIVEKPLQYWHNVKNSLLTSDRSIIRELNKSHKLNQVLNNRLTVLQLENNLLKQAVRYQSLKFEHFITTSVIGTQLMTRQQYVFANVGTTSGVQIAYPVLNNDCIIGMVDQTTASTCRILLINNHLSRIPVYVINPDCQGIIMGNDDTLLRLELKDNHYHCKPGDAVFTSGLGGIYPAHKMIGRVDSVSNQSITVRSVGSIQSTDMVQIVIPAKNLLPEKS